MLHIVVRGLQEIWCRASVLLILMSAFASVGFLLVSARNYPGADALVQLQKLEAANVTNGLEPYVHIDVPAAQQGVSRFLELPQTWRCIFLHFSGSYREDVAGRLDTTLEIGLLRTAASRVVTGDNLRRYSKKEGKHDIKVYSHLITDKENLVTDLHFTQIIAVQRLDFRAILEPK